MNEDIKGIWKLSFDGDADIEYYVENGGKVYTTWDCGEILDYITNLQEEKEDYKQRNEKAIEYINEMCLASDGYASYGDDLNPEHIVNILKGDTDGSNK